MSNSTSGLRKTAAVALGAVGLATLGSVAAAGTASAATPSTHQQHVAHQQAVAHQQHLAHESHLAHLEHENHLGHQQHLSHLASEAHAAHAAHLAHVSVSSTSSVHTQEVSYSVGSSSAVSGSPQQIAAQLVPAGQLASFDQIISHESGWNVHATNASSGAYGLGQALPGSKMASAGSDWQNSATTQIKWALSYMNQRYGSPNAAWSFWQANGWY